MKILKYFLLAVLFIVIGTLTWGYFFIEGKKPTYSGNLDLSGLDQPVEVFFDDYAVPHIYAQTEKDALTALGYVHAQERLWQMELVRRIAPGRLSEVFGKDLIETDRFFRTLGAHHYSLQSVQELQSQGGEILELAEAYLNGVNQFINSGFTPIEYDLVGLEKEEFELVDMYNVLGYMAFSFAAAHKTEPVVSYMEALPKEYLDALDMSISPNTTVIKSEGQVDTTYVAFANQVNKIFDKLPLAPFIGSNSWVVSPQKSESGSAVLCNDPHIGFAQPSVWYEAHIATPEISYYGHYLAGVPFATLAFSDKIATGLTMFENDDLDFYREKVNENDPNQYWAVDHWENFKTREETINVMDGESVTFTVQESRHGPIMNATLDNLKNEPPVAAWWTYYQFPNKVFNATYGIARATNPEEMAKSVELIHAPGLNVMYADHQGNIAWWATGKLVKRPDHVNPKTILDGASGKDDPLGYYDFSENPQAVNPSSGFVYSANNQSELNIADTSILYPGYYLHEGRAKRIVTVMEGQEKFSRQDLKDLFMDSYNQNVVEVLPVFLEALDGKELDAGQQEFANALREWDGYHNENSVGPAVYYAWLLFMFEHAMLDELVSINEDMGEQVFDTFLETHLRKRSIYTLLANDSSKWWDDVSTMEVESQNDILHKAFVSGVDYLTSNYGENAASRPWKDFHILEHAHAMGQVDALRPYFNVGPFGLSGSDENLNNLGFSLKKDGLFTVTFGPSTRRIVDFADLGTAESILPTGQSGNLFSEHYKDQAEMYATGTWRPMLFAEDQIKDAGFRKLVFE